MTIPLSQIKKLRPRKVMSLVPGCTDNMIELEV